MKKYKRILIASAFVILCYVPIKQSNLNGSLRRHSLYLPNEDNTDRRTPDTPSATSTCDPLNCK